MRTQKRICCLHVGITFSNIWNIAYRAKRSFYLFRIVFCTRGCCRSVGISISSYEIPHQETTDFKLLRSPHHGIRFKGHYSRKAIEKAEVGLSCEVKTHSRDRSARFTHKAIKILKYNLIYLTTFITVTYKLVIGMLNWFLRLPFAATHYIYE